MMLDLAGQVSASLAARGVPHAMIGAGALAVHGISRSTFDLDLLVVDRSILRADAWSELAARGVSVEARTGDDADPLAGVVRLSAPGQRSVDVVVGRHAWQRDVLRRAVPSPVGDRPVPVAIPSDLVLLKLFAGGPQDAWDVQQLVGAAADRGELTAEVERGLGNLSAEARELWRRIAGS